jgi:1-deoxy-D-xylulose-5-phosphate synthase
VTKLIDSIALPDDLRSCSTEELKTVADELREELIDCMSTSSGHFASSLGATEITVALHHAFNTPNDRIILDVGHQGYIHKMITGRRSRLSSIRQKDGLSGFLKRNESEYDSFGAGHAGTSISAGVGMAIALQKTHPERFVIPVIGDGSLTSGMAFEALNHAGSIGLSNLIVIVNDNEMSISPNVGALSWLFSKAVTSKTSTNARSRFKNLYRKGYVPEIVYKAIDRAEEAAQGFFAGPAMLFESFGFRYIGPVDGHDMGALITALENAKQQDVPVLIHAYTEKGKGYKPAEVDPIKWHAVKPFDKERGEFLSEPTKKKPPTYTEIFADTLVEHAKEDLKVVGITAAMPTGTGLNKLETEMPEQCFDVGICEQHAVTLAAGMACEGYKPVCTIYSTFLQRAYDQIVHDVCIQNLPVVFALDRAGVVGNDGETHQGAFDVAYLRSLPNMTIMAPRDENMLRHMLHSAIHHDGPVAVRYPRGNGQGVLLDAHYEKIPIGRSETLQNGDDVLFLCLGPTVSTAQQVATLLERELGVSSTVVDARFAKPLDEEMLVRQIPRHKMICTIEDHTIVGGFGSAVLESVERLGIKRQQKIFRFGIQDAFVPHASQGEQQAMNGYDVDSIYTFVAEQHANRKVVAFS